MIVSLRSYLCSAVKLVRCLVMSAALMLTILGWIRMLGQGAGYSSSGFGGSLLVAGGDRAIEAAKTRSGQRLKLTAALTELDLKTTQYTEEENV